MRSNTLVRRFFSSCAPKFSIFCSNTHDFKILPEIVSGKVSINPGLAKRLTQSDYEDFLKGNIERVSWPVYVIFRTEDRPHVPDGLSDEICSWGDRKIDVEILAYSKNHGEDFVVVEQPNTLTPGTGR